MMWERFIINAIPTMDLMEYKREELKKKLTRYTKLLTQTAGRTDRYRHFIKRILL